MRRRQWLTLGIGPAVVLAVSFVAVTPVLAAGPVGTGTAASCDEAAFDAAFAGGGLITFNCGPDPVTITFTGTKTLTADTSIDGAGMITLSGGDTVRLFSTTDFDLTLIGLVLRDAAAPAAFGAVVFASNATVAIVDSTVMDNNAGLGAVVALQITNNSAQTVAAAGSTFVGNQATGDGGVFWITANSFDGLDCLPVGFAEANAFIINSTFTSNSATGPAIVEMTNGGSPCPDNGHAVVAYSTFAGNTGDALFSMVTGPIGVLEAELAASVIGPNEADCAFTAGNGLFTSLGYNVTDDASCFAAATGDQVVADTMLGPLASNGGLTQTMALLPGSAALDAIPPGSAECGTITADQRLVARPQGVNCDAGAYEQVVLTDTATSPRPAPVPSPLELAGWLIIGLAAATGTRRLRQPAI